MIHPKAKLFSEFPPISTEKWKEKILSDLKGVDFEKKLVWNTNEGFSVMPFYRSEDIRFLKTTDSLPGEFPYVRGTKKCNDWLVRQDIIVTNFAEANKKALNILDQGITSLGFKISGEDVNEENIHILLAGILPQVIEINFTTCCMISVKLIRILIDYFNNNNYDLAQINGSINIDFIGAVLTRGVIKKEWMVQIKEAILASTELPAFRVLPVNAYLLNNAGSLISQELGYALAWGNELLSRLVNENVHVTDVAKKIKFNFGISSNYFLEIAKFRAARWLWAEIIKAYEPHCHNNSSDEEWENKWLCSAKMNVFAQTSTFNQTVFDAHVNLLRTQTEAMSASIAGVDSLLIIPFDETFKIPDDFSERIARNQQLLLKEECHFDKVADISGGSYYIESLTHSIALEAWKIFLETEEKGFYELVKAGEIQKAVNTIAEKRFKSLSQRREVLLGINQFPNFMETAREKVEFSRQNNNSCIGHCIPCIVLNTRRLSEEFETLRLHTEKFGKEVKAFMLTIGNLTMRLARSQFSCNILACAGYKVIDNLGFETVEQGITAARQANASIIVLCSSDDEYSIYAPEAHKLIDNKEILIIAGSPACMEDLKVQGITNFINTKSNVLATLQSLNSTLGIGIG